MSRSVFSAAVVAGLGMLLVAPQHASAKGKKDPTSPRQADGDPLPTPEPSLLIQPWFTLWDQDVDPITDPAGYGDPEDDFGFKIRRARIGLGAKGDNVRYDVTFGFSSGFDAVNPPGSESIQIISAEGAYRPVKGVWLSGGIQKVPVSRDFLMSASQLVAGDRAVGSAWMIPQREVGAVVDLSSGDSDGDGFKARLRSGVFNGNGSLTGDDNPGKLVSVRAEGVYGPGNVYRTWGRVKGFTIGFAGNYWQNADLGAKTVAYGGDVILRVEGLALLGEFHQATIEPTDADIVMPGVLAETPRRGMVGQLGY